MRISRRPFPPARARRVPPWRLALGLLLKLGAGAGAPLRSGLAALGPFAALAPVAALAPALAGCGSDPAAPVNDDEDTGGDPDPGQAPRPAPRPSGSPSSNPNPSPTTMAPNPSSPAPTTPPGRDAAPTSTGGGKDAAGANDEPRADAGAPVDASTPSMTPAGMLDPHADAGPPAAPLPRGILGSVAEGGGIKESPKAFEDRLYRIDVSVSLADWNRMQANAERYDTEGTYIPAMVTIDGVAQGKVGFRYKGAWGTFRRCLRGADGKVAGVVPNAPLGGGCTNKFPFKVDFAAYEPMKRWNGLKKINLHSLLNDGSKVREKVAYQVYRAMGIVTARATHASVTVDVQGTRLTGLFGLVENVTDGRFTADHWPGDKDGNLYKTGWPTTTAVDYWERRLETNVEGPPPPSHDKVLAFARAVTGASDPARVLAVLESHTSVEHFARMLAVQTAVKDGDSPARWSCNSTLTYCTPNNFLLYQLAKQDKFLFVPWDTDDALHQPSAYDVLPPWDEPASCTTSFRLFGGDHRAASCDPILRAMALPGPKKHYQQAMADLAAGPMEPRALTAKIDTWAAYMRPAVVAGNRATINGIVFDWTTPVGAWEGAVNDLKATIRTLHGMTRGAAEGKKFRPWPR